jgi:hypothetical protein
MGREGAVGVTGAERMMGGARSYQCSPPGLKVSWCEQCVAGRG